MNSTSTKDRITREKAKLQLSRLAIGTNLSFSLFFAFSFLQKKRALSRLRVMCFVALVNITTSLGFWLINFLEKIEDKAGLSNPTTANWLAGWIQEEEGLESNKDKKERKMSIEYSPEL